MHRGQHAAPARSPGDDGEVPALPLGQESAQELATIPQGLLPLTVSGPPGCAVRTAGIEPATPRAAREFTRETLRRWDLYSAYQDTAVVVSELVTNALRYGARIGSAVAAAAVPGAVQLTLWCRVSYLICVVTDPNPEPPVLQPPNSCADSGRGLQVVQALTSSWGWTMLGGRQKVVWAALELPEAREPVTAQPAGPQPAASLSTGPGGKARGLCCDLPEARSTARRPVPPPCPRRRRPAVRWASRCQP
ncbi:MAG: ATP-binding protein [Actinomycetota bacterium]